MISDTEKLDLARSEQERRRYTAEAEQLAGDFPLYAQHAFKVLRPDDEFVRNWHIDAILEHLTAVTDGEITRLIVNIPPFSMKSLGITILWPTWEWATRPSLQYWTASYHTNLSWRGASRSLFVMKDPWWQNRWGDNFRWVSEAQDYFSNSQGGYRLSTSPSSEGTGYHGHRIIIDDPVDAKAADAESQARMKTVNEWYDGTVESRGFGDNHARIIVMQRLHQNDLCAHVREKEEWVNLVLPERYDPGHPYAWRRDPRHEDELLWPAHRGARASDAMASGMSRFRAAAQLQQLPAAREGEILKRHWWRFYNPKLFTDPKYKDRRPPIRLCVQSVDAPLKDKQSNDLLAVQAWGAAGANRYLLDLRKGNMSYSQAKRAIIEQARHVRTLFPHAEHRILIESAGYGDELVYELKQELTGVTKLSHAREGDKILRAEAASADLESGNVYLPGHRMGSDELSMPDEARCSADIVDFVNSCAVFPNGRYDDDVDAFTQAVNWIRVRPQGRSRTWSSFKNKQVG